MVFGLCTLLLWDAQRPQAGQLEPNAYGNNDENINN
jgi:hypothetical protein